MSCRHVSGRWWFGGDGVSPSSSVSLGQGCYWSILQLAKQTVRYLFYVNPTLDLGNKDCFCDRLIEPFCSFQKDVCLDYATVDQLEYLTNIRIPRDSAISLPSISVVCIAVRISYPLSIHTIPPSVRGACLNS